MRADRLISLLMLLQTRGQMTAQELAARLEVSPRTIYRDLDALSGAGVPVYAERGPQGGCRLLESYRTNLTGLKEAEVQALFMFTVPGLLADLGVHQDAESAYLKLSAALPVPFQQDAERVRRRLYLDPAGWFQHDEPTPYLPIIQQALWNEQRVRILYRRADGIYVKRIISPYGLVAKAGVWYVVGRSFQWVQVFRITRIQEAVLTSQSFVRPEDFELAAYWSEWCARFEQTQERFAVNLLVSPAGETKLVEQFGEGMVSLLQQATVEESSGRFLITLHFSSAEDACQRLLPLGIHVTVLEPDSLRRMMADFSWQVFKHYSLEATD